MTDTTNQILFIGLLGGLVAWLFTQWKSLLIAKKEIRKLHELISKSDTERIEREDLYKRHDIYFEKIDAISESKKYSEFIKSNPPKNWSQEKIIQNRRLVEMSNVIGKFSVTGDSSLHRYLINFGCWHQIENRWNDPKYGNQEDIENEAFNVAKRYYESYNEALGCRLTWGDKRQKI